MSKKPSNFKLRADLERAAALVQAGRFAEAAPLLRALAPEFPSSDAYRLLVHCLDSAGDEHASAHAALEGAKAFPADEALNLRAGAFLYEQGDLAGSVERFKNAGEMLRDEPEAHARYAHALLELGRTKQAFDEAKGAYAHRANGVPALIYGMAALSEGDVDAARDGLTRAANSLEGPARGSAENVLALVLLWKGETARALGMWKALDRRGELDADLTAHLAVAAALAGDEPTARDALSRTKNPSSPAALLATARVELALVRPAEALAALERIDSPGELSTLIAATRGRALRMLSRSEEAKAALSPLENAEPPAVAAMALTDLGRLASDEGRHEEAAHLFERALQKDPGAADAARGLELAKQRLAWRADAKSQVDAARAEAEAMRRAFAERERELELLRRKLAQLEKAAGDAEAEGRAAREAEEAARRTALARELEIREREAPARAEEALAEAFGDALSRCPAPVLDLLRVAEVTYQKALYTELHPASVAVLFSGALERGLYTLLVLPFDRSLSPADRATFLKTATRELRPGRAEYFDRFVEAFDRERKVRPPSLGEIGRALSKRSEPHLAAFRQFLSSRFDVGDAFFDALAGFIERTKEELRDPVAHGHVLELSQADLNRFRRELLFDLGGMKRGALPALVAAGKN